MRVIFMGTPQFAAGVLDGILNSKHTVTAVITQPDRINARGNKSVPCAVKTLADAQNLPIFQFERIGTELGAIRAISKHADIMVTAAYGQILPQSVLDATKHGVINAHASILPKYRGSSPVQWALINGEAETGITIMRIVLKVDAGDVLLTKKISLSDIENADECLARLTPIAADAIVEALDLIESGRAAFTPQDESQATTVRFLEKSDGLLDFSASALSVYNRVRGVFPWPGAFTPSPIGVLKFIKVAPVVNSIYDVVPTRAGTVIASSDIEGLIIKCGEGAVSVLTIQAENAKAMPIADFLRGKKIPVGTVLGEEI